MSDPVLLCSFKGHKGTINGLDFHPDNENFVSCSSDGNTFGWSIPKRKKIYNFSGQTQDVTCVQFSPFGEILASGSTDRSVHFWLPSFLSGSVSFKGHSSAVRTLCFSSTGETLYTGSNDKSIKLWDVNTRRFLHSLIGHNNWVWCVKELKHMNLLASCSDDKTVRLWDLNSAKCVHIFNIVKSKACYLDVHPNDQAIAVAVASGSVKLYDVRARKLQQYYLLHDQTTSVAWHPCGNHLLSSGIDGTMKIIDVVEGRPLYTLQYHEGRINALSFSKNGEYIISGGSDKNINLWRSGL